MDTLSPALHCGSCLKGAGAGQGCRGSPCGKKAEKAKPPQRLLPLQELGLVVECRGRRGEGGSIGAAGAAVLVTVPDSTVLAQQSQGQGTVTGRGRESASLGVTRAGERKPCGIWPFSQTGVGQSRAFSCPGQVASPWTRATSQGVWTGSNGTGGKNSIYFQTQAGELCKL